MEINLYVRNEWQPFSVSVSEGQPHVSVYDVNCIGRIESGVVMVMLSFNLKLEETGDPGDFTHVSFDVGATASLEKVRFTTIMTSVDPETSEERYSTAMLEYSSRKLECRAFPFLPNREYEVKTQFFYRIAAEYT